MPKTTTTYHHGDLRNALIQAGLSILQTDGEATLTLRKVAREAGVSHAAPYRHFADKTALLSAIAQQGFDLLTAQLQAAATDFSDTPQRILLETGLNYIQFARQYPDHFRLMFGGVLRAAGPDAPLRAAAEQTFAQVVNAVATSQACGIVKAGDTHQLATTAWSMAHGLADLAVEGMLGQPTNSTADVEQIARFSLQQLLVGLLGR